MSSNSLCRIITASVIVILTLGLATARADQRVEADEDVQRLHASEKALDYLVQIGELRTGVTVLNFRIDPAMGCVSMYGSAVCPIPGKSRLYALRAAGRLDVEPEVVRLQLVADFDNSGFVTDEEGKRFGVLVHFGQQLDYLVTAGETSVDRIGRLIRLSEAELHSRLDDYRELARRADRLGVDLLRVPAIGVKSAGAPPKTY